MTASSAAGRSADGSSAPPGSGRVISSNALVWIWAVIAIIVIAGTAAYLASGN